jgi:hypothetical protein
VIIFALLSKRRARYRTARGHTNLSEADQAAQAAFCSAPPCCFL